MLIIGCNRCFILRLGIPKLYPYLELLNDWAYSPTYSACKWHCSCCPSYNFIANPRLQCSSEEVFASFVQSAVRVNKACSGSQTRFFTVQGFRVWGP